MSVPSETATTETCTRHPFEVAERICHQCGHWHCDGCLVAPWGPRKPMLCVECAIGSSGVRRSAGTPPARSAREIRQLERGARRQEREDEKRPVVITPNGLSRTTGPVVTAEDPPTRRSLLRRLRPA